MTTAKKSPAKKVAKKTATKKTAGKAAKKSNPCWPGFEPAPGKKPGTK
jgi:hypothetical protein